MNHSNIYLLHFNLCVCLLKPCFVLTLEIILICLKYLSSKLLPISLAL